MPTTILDSLFNAIINQNNTEIKRISAEKLLPKKLGVKEVPKGIKKLEVLVSNKLLSNAIDENDKSKVKKLLGHKLFSSKRKYNIDIENSGMLKVTPLMHAVQKGDSEMVKLLVEEGAEINAQIDSGPTPLILASQMGHEDIAKYLIEKGSMVGLSDKQGKNAIMWAAQSNQDKMVNALLERDANPINPDNEGMNPMKYSVRNNALDSAKALLEGIKKNYNSKIMQQQATYALRYACTHGNVEMAKFLISNGANPHHTFEDLKTPLATAVESGNADLVDYLLEKGARPSRVDLERALVNLNAEHDDRTIMFKALLKHGADPRSEEKIFETFMPLVGSLAQRALMSHNSEALDILFKDYNFDPNEKFGMMGACLDLASINFSERLGDTIKVILKNGADPTSINPLTNQTAFEYLLCKYPTDSLEFKNYIKDGIGEFINHAKENNLESSMLMDAAKSAIKTGRIEAIEAMIDKGLDVNQQDIGGNTMLKVAFEEANPEIVGALLKKGADPNIKNVFGKNVVDRSTEVLLANTNEYSKSAEMVFDSLKGKQVGRSVDSRLSNPNSWEERIAGKMREENILKK